MRILFVAPYFPIPQRSGGKVRVFHVLRELARTEQITLACYLSHGSAPFVREVESWGVEVRSIEKEIRSRPVGRHLRFLPTAIPFSLVDPDPAMTALVRELCATGSYDVLQVEFLAMAYLADQGALEGRCFLTHHYSATDHYRRVLRIQAKTSVRYWANLVDSLKIAPYERRALEQFSAVFVTSERDRELLSDIAPRANLVVANNGVDTAFYRSRRSNEAIGSKLLVSTCSFATDTNIDSVVWFLEEIWPRVIGREPYAQYQIIGYDPPESIRRAAARQPGVTVVGGVDDVRPYLDRAAASLITMRAGSGTKIRALTSLAMGLPIIATPLGAEGLQVGEEGGVFVGRSANTLADLAVRVLQVGVPAATRSRARAYIEQHHSWHNAVDAMKKTYQEALGR